MKILGLDHIAFVVRDIEETIARAGDTVDGRALGERILAGDIDLQFLLCGETRLELTEVRAAGFGMPKLKDGETAVIGHIGIEVDDPLYMRGLNSEIAHASAPETPSETAARVSGVGAGPTAALTRV